MASSGNERLVPMFKMPWCVECCDTHDSTRRQAILARLDNPTPADVYDSLGGLAEHLWPKNCQGAQRRLERDIAAMRKRCGLKDHQPDPVNVEAIVRFARRGLGPASIAMLMRLNRERVRWVLKGLRMRTKGDSKGPNFVVSPLARVHSIAPRRVSA